MAGRMFSLQLSVIEREGKSPQNQRGRYVVQVDAAKSVHALENQKANSPMKKGYCKRMCVGVVYQNNLIFL